VSVPVLLYCNEVVKIICLFPESKFAWKGEVYQNVEPLVFPKVPLGCYLTHISIKGFVIQLATTVYVDPATSIQFSPSYLTLTLNLP